MALTLPDWIRLSTGLIWVAFGVWLGLLGPRSHRTRPVATVLVAIGTTAAVSNAAYADPRWAAFGVVVTLLFELVVSAGVAWLFVAEARVHRRNAIACAATSLGLGIAGGMLAWASPVATPAAVPPDSIFAVLDRVDRSLFAVLMSALGGYALLLALLTGRAEVAEARALVTLAAGLVTYPLAYFFAGVTPPLALAVLVSAFPLLAALVAIMHAGAVAGRTARLAYVVAFAVALVTILAERPGRDVGLVGIARVVSLGVIAYGVFSLGALGPSRHAAQDRSAALLTGSLVALLIVTQVAQNFLSSQYSLLMGGIVSGALVFAARPLERALEARRGPARVMPAADAARERSFLAAARRFHRDGSISREEERELMILAEHLAIPPSRAYELRDEVERERR